jgi:sugar lactone lactonase YvrE
LALTLVVFAYLRLSPGTPADASYGSPSAEGASTPNAAQVRIERISAAVPWPRGLRFIDGQLYAVARGEHRSAGGPQADIEDHAGSIFVIDPDVAEPAIPSSPVTDAVRHNGRILAAATGAPFRVWNRVMPAIEDRFTDQPYCMLVYDEASQNFFVCGYSGIDLPYAPGFRKNATDSVHRFDLRDNSWHVVEAHDPSVVPAAEQTVHVSSVYYPHHDIATNAPPHGLVNGPCGAVVTGKYLYVGAKDNTALAQYDLSAIRESSAAPAPPGRYIFEGSAGHAVVNVKGHGETVINGTCAMTVGGGYLYVAFRTTSQILRFPLNEDGSVVEPLEAELVAQFPRYDPVRKRGSANIYDMAFDAEGRLYVSPGYDGGIYRFFPDPDRPFDSERDGYVPYVDLEALVGVKKSGNICFDDAGNLYVCCGKKVLDDGKIAGVIYRIRPRS